MMQGA